MILDAAAGAASPRWVRLEARVLPVGDTSREEIEIRVTDSGPGVPSDCMEDAFTRGWSTKPKDRLHGRGLGLALVAQAAHRNHGTVEVRNEGGAVFTVRMPDQHLASATVRCR